MDFRDLYKQTEKVGMEEFSKIVSSKGIKSLNESGDPKVMVTAKENDSVTFLVGDKKYVYKGLSPSLIDRFEGRLKNKAGFKALNWLKAQTAKEQRFEVKDGKEVSTNESSSFPTNFTKLLKTSSGKIKHPADKGKGCPECNGSGQDEANPKEECVACGGSGRYEDYKVGESKINERDSLEAWRETIEEESKKIGIKSHSKMDVDNCLKFIAKHYGAIQANKAIDDFKLESKGYKKLKVNESADDMSDEELMAWYKEEMSKGLEPRLINSLKLKLEARGLKVDESKKVNEDDMMNGGATTASDSSNVVANPNPPTVDNDVNKEEQDQVKKSKSTKDDIADDAEKEEDEESKKDLTYLGNSGGDKYFYLYEKPAAEMDESVEVKTKKFPTKEEADKFLAKVVIDEKTDTPFDPSFGSKVRAKGLADRTPAGIPTDKKEEEIKLPNRKEVLDKHFKANDEVEELEKSWKADNSKVPNESKITEISQKDIPSYLSAHIKRAKEIGQDPINYLMTRFGHTKKEAQVALEKYGKEDYKEPIQGDYYPESIVHIPYTLVERILKLTELIGVRGRNETEDEWRERQNYLIKALKATGNPKGAAFGQKNLDRDKEEIDSIKRSWKTNKDVPNESKVNEVIKKIGRNKWQVQSHTGKSLGTYSTKEEAVTRLRQVEYFKAHPDKTNESEEKEWIQLKDGQIEKYKQYRKEGLSHPDAINKAKEVEESKDEEKEGDLPVYCKVCGEKHYPDEKHKNESKVNESCPDCGSNEVRDGKCGHCGNPIGGVECPDCGSKEVVNGKCKHCQNPIGARECPGCGSKETVNGKCKYCGRVTEAYTTSSDTSGQPANSKAAAQDVKDSASHEKSQTGLGQVKEDTDYDDKTPAKIADLQILDAEDEVVFSAKKHQLDPNDVKGFLTAALKELKISNISYDVVIDYLLPTEDEVVNPEEPTDEELKAEPTEEPYPAAQGEPVPQQQDKNESIDKSLLEKFGLTPPIEVDGSTSMWAPGEDDSPDANTDDEPVNPYEVDESLMLKYGFLTESTATLFEKFGLIIDEANENLSPEDIARIKKMVDEEYKKEHKDKLTEPKKDKKVNEIEDLSTPDVNGVPSITGVDQEKNQLPTNQQADKAPGIVEKPGVGLLTTESKDATIDTLDMVEAKLKESKKLNEAEYTIVKMVDGLFDVHDVNGFTRYTSILKEESEAWIERKNSLSRLNEDGEGLVPNQPTSDQTVNQDVPPQGEPTATDDPTMADSGEDTDKEPAADYSTPESAMAQIDMDYPEEPLKSLALAFCDSFINDPNVYKGLRKMQFEGTWVDADTINDLAKVVGDYRNFTPDVIKLTSERLGNGCKYKLGRNNGPTLTLVLRDPDFSISLSGLKELVNAKEVNKTDNPGEVVLSW